MNLMKNNLTIRNAAPADAEQLCLWWNDGKIMAHAGYPNGLNEQPENIRKSLATDTDATHRRHVIEHNGTPIGEMNYRNKGNGVAEIGIKICDFTQQEKGLGTTLLSMFIDALFVYYGYDKIILDTNVNNTRAQHVYKHKLGFRQVKVGDTYIDYDLTKECWQARQTEPLNYLHIRLERPHEHYAVEELTRDAHWDGNGEVEPSICDVHLLVSRLRQCPSYVPQLNYVAELNGKLAGHIIYSTSKIVDDAGKEYGTLTFGPLSTLPKYQNQGIGKALLRYTLGEATRLGFRAVLIFGHPDYYPRVGFRRAAEFGITTSDGKNFDPFMAYPLYDGALDGIHGCYYLDPVYDNLTQEDVDAFDKKFPAKALHVPIPMSVLFDRLPPPAQKALEELKQKALKVMTTKSERELLAMDGIDSHVIEIIRAVMREYGLCWGTHL